MTIYERPTKALMRDFVAAENIQKGQIFKKEDAVRWFHAHYPNINPTTVRMHVDGMSVNSRSRKHHRSIKPGSGSDLFFKLGPDQYRLWDKEADAAPVYADTLIAENGSVVAEPEIDNGSDDEPGDDQGSKEFALESDLRNYLARNLSRIESGLRLYDEEEISGIEFPVGGRFIDILAKDKDGGFVVIELKVSRGYDRTIGQLLRYMGWVDANLAQGKPVRGVIVAASITEDLKLAASRVPGVKLVEYELSFSLRPIT